MMSNKKLCLSLNKHLQPTTHHYTICLHFHFVFFFFFWSFCGITAMAYLIRIKGGKIDIELDLFRLTDELKCFLFWLCFVQLLQRAFHLNYESIHSSDDRLLPHLDFRHILLQNKILSFKNNSVFCFNLIESYVCTGLFRYFQLFDR